MNSIAKTVLLNLSPLIMYADISTLRLLRRPGWIRLFRALPDRQHSYPGRYLSSPWY